MALRASWLSDIIHTHVHVVRAFSTATCIALISADSVEHVSCRPTVVEIGFPGLATPIPYTPFRTAAAVYIESPGFQLLSAWIASSGASAITISGWVVHGAGRSHSFAIAPSIVGAVGIIIVRRLSLCILHIADTGVVCTVVRGAYPSSKYSSGGRTAGTAVLQPVLLPP